MTSKTFIILLLLSSFVSCTNKRVETNYTSDSDSIVISDNPEMECEKQNEEDGFVWVLKNNIETEESYAYDENDNLILGPFYHIEYSPHDGRFHVCKLYEEGDYKVLCSGVYEKNGEEIISYEKGYNTIYRTNIKSEEEDDDYYYTVAYQLKGKTIYGAISKNGTIITYPFSDHKIYYDNESEHENHVKKFEGYIGDNYILILKYLDDKGNVYSYGDYETVYIVPKKYYSPDDGFKYKDNPNFYKVSKFKSFIVYGGEKYSKSSEEYQGGYFYSNNDRSIFVSDYDVKDEDFYYDQKITIYQFYYPNENSEIVINDKIKKERIKEFFAMASDIRTHHIEDVAKKQKNEEIKYDDSAEELSSSNNTFNQNIFNKNPNNNNSIDNTPRNPSRYPCRACQRNPGVCGGCDGTRQIKQYYNSSTGTWTMRPCNACGGTGTCHACKGDGWIDEGVDF